MSFDDAVFDGGYEEPPYRMKVDYARICPMTDFRFAETPETLKELRADAQERAA
jgi:hypothetical protein